MSSKQKAYVFSGLITTTSWPVFMKWFISVQFGTACWNTQVRFSLKLYLIQLVTRPFLALTLLWLGLSNWSVKFLGEVRSIMLSCRRSN